MKYTIILRRSSWLCGIFDNEDSEFYVANGDIEFENVQAAAKAARKEAAKADEPDLRYVMSERGYSVQGKGKIDLDNYEVVLAIEGQHKPMFGWQPELCGIGN